MHMYVKTIEINFSSILNTLVKCTASVIMGEALQASLQLLSWTAHLQNYPTFPFQTAKGERSCD